MKIQKSCNEKPAKQATPSIKSLPSGTIFYYGTIGAAGPFLRTSAGAVNLAACMYYDDAAFGNVLPNYRELPNAYLVTGEE